MSGRGLTRSTGVAGIALWVATLGSQAPALAHAQEPVAPPLPTFGAHGAATACPVLPSTARVEYVRGEQVIAQPAASAEPLAGAGRAAPASPPAIGAAPVTVGASLAEGTRVKVPEDGYLRLRLADGSVVQVLAGSDVELRHLRARSGGTEAVIELRKGKAEFDVVKPRKDRIFEIRAPGAVASVRGTRLAVSVDANGHMRTTVTEGEVAVHASEADGTSESATSVRAGQGIVVPSDGRPGALKQLAAAPDLSGLTLQPADAGRMVLDLGTAAPADYEVSVARDKDFQEVVRNGVARGGRLEFPALEHGFYVVGVRTLDANELAGAETQRRIFLGANPPAAGMLPAAAKAGQGMAQASPP